jgi:hypothetical protein
MADPNPNFNAIASTTLKNYRKKFADNVTNGNEFLRFMKMKGSVVEDGGETIVEELMYGATNGGSYSGSDTMNIDIPEGLSAAEYNWKQYYETIVITGTEKIQNSGKSAMQKLLTARTKQAEIGMANRLGTHLYLNGTGNGGKDILGLDAICDVDPTTGVLGGIDRANFTFWRNYTNAAVGSFATNGLAAISTAIRALTRGKDRPTAMFTGSTIYGYAQAAAAGRAQFNNPKLADLNFAALKVEGIDFIYDPQCPPDRIYLINTDYLKLYIHRDENFVLRPFVEPADQRVEVAKYLAALQLCTSNASLQGVLSGITA